MTVVGAIPADRAVPVRRDNDASIPAGVHRPRLAATCPAPFLRSGGRRTPRGRGSSRGRSALHPARSQGFARCRGRKRKILAAQRGTGSVPPAVNCQAFSARRERQAIAWRGTRQRERPQVKSKDGPRRSAIAKIDNFAILGHSHDVVCSRRSRTGDVAVQTGFPSASMRPRQGDDEATRIRLFGTMFRPTPLFGEQ